jgi:hypothetical protein
LEKKKLTTRDGIQNVPRRQTITQRLFDWFAAVASWDYQRWGYDVIFNDMGEVVAIWVATLATKQIALYHGANMQQLTS